MSTTFLIVVESPDSVSARSSRSTSDLVQITVLVSIRSQLDTFRRLYERIVLLPSWLRIFSPSSDSCTVTRSEPPSLFTMDTLNRSVLLKFAMASSGAAERVLRREVHQQLAMHNLGVLLRKPVHLAWILLLLMLP